MTDLMDAPCALRKAIVRIEDRQTAALASPGPASLGHAPIDAAIGGGLARGRLHELFAATPEDGGSAAGFAAMLARLVAPGDAPLVWLRQQDAERQGGQLHAPGLAEIGIDPARLLLILLPDPVALLRAAADVVRCTELGAAVIELWRNPRALDLTASRRLALAAEASGVTTLLLRVEAEPAPSAAQTRWSIAAAPSLALDADAPGLPAFDVQLLRQRGRPDGGRWLLEWDRDRACFREAPLPGAVVSPAAGQSLVGGARRRA